MQKMGLTPRQLRLYAEYLQSDHDYWIWAEVLDLSENPKGQVDVLDGQVNLTDDPSAPLRTCSLTVSDPAHALSFGASLAEDDDGVLWVNRLVRVRHRVVVPDVGRVTATPFIGLPTSVARNGAELGVELGDKSLLADHGVRERSFKKGQNAAGAIRTILRDCTGEHKLSIPKSTKKLSRPYTVGLSDETITPWKVAKRIAREELGWRLYYTCNGIAKADPLHGGWDRVEVKDLLELPDTQTSFTDFKNYVKVTTARKSTKRDTKHKALTADYDLPDGSRLSESSLARNGVPRLLPIYVEEDSYKSQRQVDERAKAELRRASALSFDASYSVIPFFHLDNGDKLLMPNDIGPVPLDVASIPLGTGGPMTVGSQRWVSRPIVVRRNRQRKAA